jgi:hypothetical protein
MYRWLTIAGDNDCRAVSTGAAPDPVAEFGVAATAPRAERHQVDSRAPERNCEGICAPTNRNVVTIAAIISGAATNSELLMTTLPGC